jgi:hypothetical protein
MAKYEGLDEDSGVVGDTDVVDSIELDLISGLAVDCKSILESTLRVP